MFHQTNFISLEKVKIGIYNEIREHFQKLDYT